MQSHLEHLRAIVFDVDGTLYHQGPIRRTVLWRLLRTHVFNPARGLLTLRVLDAYRKAQETLRTVDVDHSDLAKTQICLASEWTGVNSEFVSSCVTRWMEREPLGILARSLRKGLLEFLWETKRCGLRLGIFSDYPAGAKLEAMGVASAFNVVVSAQDPEVQKFKPSPRGLRVTIQRLGVEAREALYIGDRPEVDACAAAAAGVGCAIISRRRKLIRRCEWIEISNYEELRKIIGDELYQNREDEPR